MGKKSIPQIVIENARTHNLKNISLNIPHNQFIVVTGISGSGKSSLVFDIIAKEGQRRYFETLPSFARSFMGKLNRPDVDVIEGLSPVITVSQKTSGINSRSTVGTMSDIYDLLRLLFARTGETSRDIELSRSRFSFNSEIGKCPRCAGIGKEEKIDIHQLIRFPEKSIREGALAPTLPTGYIMYSQVTIDVLNQVCEAEGFNVDIPWNQLTETQRNIILYGSDTIKVPFGKHSLESRLKWTGIKAKPREEGYYKGIIPIMTDILRRDRNANILKYVHSVTCTECAGRRLNLDALSVQVRGKSIDEFVTSEIGVLNRWLKKENWDTVGSAIVEKISTQISLLEDLGLGYLTLNRPAKTLSGSEIQRIKVANQITASLSNVLYIFDEPSIGLHRDENVEMIRILKELVHKGNTVIVVEHDLNTIHNADWIIDIGPKAGTQGGQLLFNGCLPDFLANDKLRNTSPTFRSLTLKPAPRIAISKASNTDVIHLKGCQENNLKNIDVEFHIGKLNVVSGKSGTGKSSLVKQTLQKLVNNEICSAKNVNLKLDSYENIHLFDKQVFVDQSPIGRTPRSNPATYLGLSDDIRDLFASLPESKVHSFTKSRFSFNNKGGRCETCQGAGKTQVGMHFLGNVELVCAECKGKRFNDETLEIKYRELSIADIYDLTIDEALDFFTDHKKLRSKLEVLKNLGLGYLTLGQSSTTLSGGEAQRIKIANELQKKDLGKTLYILDEPSIGLHHFDIQYLLHLFNQIKQKGSTIVCIEQDEEIIRNADWHIEMGPKGGSQGGSILYQGTARGEQVDGFEDTLKSTSALKNGSTETITLNGVSTHLLKNIDVRIPKNQITVVTGLSGSGKSSLVYDTLFSEAQSRFSESLSTYNRGFLKQNNKAKIEECIGLGPAIAIHRRRESFSKRSTLGTLTGVYDSFRLLYSRLAQLQGASHTAQSYSFNHRLGACPKCKGLGVEVKCDPELLIIQPERSIFNGAISPNKAVKYYSDQNGQFMATLSEVAKQKTWDLDRPWNQLEEPIKQAILYGTGEIEWDVIWEFKTKSRSGSQSLSSKWLGFCNYINGEYHRRLHNKNVKDLEDLLHEVECDNCQGSRLKKELLETKFQGKNIHELCQLPMNECLEFIRSYRSIQEKEIAAISKVVLLGVEQLLNTLIDLGLGYLRMDRTTQSLSGGELQRASLAGQLSTHLYGVTYILDEPTIGLDKEQVTVLIQVLREIVANGNSVVVVEHDKDFIRNADYLIEMGPGSGQAGGEVMFQGDLKAIQSCPNTITYQLLKRNVSSKAKEFTLPTHLFGIKGAFMHNLKQIDVNFQSNRITAITGVSGSGKSSLIKEILYQSYTKNRAIGCQSVFGLDQFDKVLLVDQRAIATNALSTPASYLGILERIKFLFSKSEHAKALGLKKADFSYQSKVGKCQNCAGYGQVKTSMDFMSDIWLPCDVCDGMRYNAKILGCHLNHCSIGDVLQMTINEAVDYFEDPQITKNLTLLKEIGIGHLKLGQSGNTLSGGEAQRIKLAKEVLDQKEGQHLYLLDEPSTGLHYIDLLKLIEIFENLKVSHEYFI